MGGHARRISVRVLCDALILIFRIAALKPFGVALVRPQVRASLAMCLFHQHAARTPAAGPRRAIAAEDASGQLLGTFHFDADVNTRQRPRSCVQLVQNG